LCKLKGGRKAKEIITSFLISKIKQEMIMSGKSIKTIAYEYGFSDQSSMGKFFSKNTGMSPSEFRKGYKLPLSIEE
jgi:YesN/AraC family two-component response regulator